MLSTREMFEQEVYYLKAREKVNRYHSKHVDSLFLQKVRSASAASFIILSHLWGDVGGDLFRLPVEHDTFLINEATTS